MFDNIKYSCCFRKTLSNNLEALPLFKFSFQKSGGYGFTLAGEIIEGTAGLALTDLNSKVFEVLSIDDFEEAIFKFFDKECFYFNTSQDNFADLFSEYLDENDLEKFSKISDVFFDFGQKKNIEFQHIKNYY